MFDNTIAVLLITITIPSECYKSTNGFRLREKEKEHCSDGRGDLPTWVICLHHLITGESVCQLQPSPASLGQGV